MSKSAVQQAQVIDLVRAETGIPVTPSTIEKAAMNGRGPKVAARFGRAYLYAKRDALEWARGLINPLAA